MRRVWILSAVLLLGCPLVTKFSHYDTTVTIDGGTSPVSLALSASNVHVRATESARLTATITRADMSLGAALTVTALPTGVVADPVRIEPGASSVDVTLHFAPGSESSAAPLLGKSFTPTVTATLDGEASANAGQSFTLEVWGPPGAIEAARTVNVAFDQKTIYNEIGRANDGQSEIVARSAAFVGEDLAIVTTRSIVRVAPEHPPVTLPLSVPGAFVVSGATIAGYDGGINVIASGPPQTGSFVTALLHGPLSSLTTGESVAIGTICLIDATATRAVCRGKTAGATTLHAVESALLVSDIPLASYQDVQVTTVLSTARGWLLCGATLPPTRSNGFFVSLVDGKGVPVSDFSVSAGAPTRAMILDAVPSGDGFLVTGYDDVSGNGPAMVVRRYLASGALDTKFGDAGTLTNFTPASLTGILLSDSPQGMLVAGRQATGETLIRRVSADTGALDKTFGTAGTVRIGGTKDPIALGYQSSRIRVASHTALGAQVNYLFP